MINLNRNGLLLSTIVSLLLILSTSLARAQDHTSFAAPEDAVDALIDALGSYDVPKLRTLLGPDSEDIFSSGDPVADKNASASFLARYREKHSLVPEGDSTMILQVGDEDWPLPVPIVKVNGKWYLDGAAGTDEVVYRRIGRNELGAIAVCHGFVDAQNEYAAEGHDGNDAGIFAAKLRSDPGQHNGLYWQTSEDEPQSPLGEAVARAAAEGYRAVVGKRRPYHGYYYRMLYAQGDSANGGAQDYFVDGLLVNGVALIAWPAEYGVSGVMTFIVNHKGVVYQQDLGEDTNALAEKIDVFNPDSPWAVVDAEKDS